MKAVRRVQFNETKTLYLTFDDGPSASSTEKVLEMIEENKIQATFFVVAEKARQSKEILKRMAKNGHGIGNHSLDHSYWKFFQGKKALTSWVKESEDIISQIIGKESIGFRPPAGVCTPELHLALRELNLPLILWNRRFFDTVFVWKKARAIDSLKRTESGSIVLLHDRQNDRKLPLFIDTLRAYISSAQKQGFLLKPLLREICKHESK